MTGLRLDQFLSSYLPVVSRTRISASIRDGLIKVGGVKRKSSYRLKIDEIISGTVLQQPGIDLLPEKVDFHVLFEDDLLLVLSKPPGVVVHPGSGNHNGTLANGLVFYCQAIAEVGDRLRPGIVHRLDKDTSGIMVAAKTDWILSKLVELFKNRDIKKSYIALLHGTLAERNGRIAAPIGRHPVNRQKMAVLPRNGRFAASSWEVLDEFNGKFSLVKIGIETGRTHQIRVHMAHLGHPVVGDMLYGSNRDNDNFPRQLLHAHRLVFKHPVTNKIVDRVAPLWSDFVTVLSRLGWQNNQKLLL